MTLWDIYGLQYTYQKKQQLLWDIITYMGYFDRCGRYGLTFHGASGMDQITTERRVALEGLAVTAGGAAADSDVVTCAERPWTVTQDPIR